MGKQQMVKRRQGRTDIQGYLYEKLKFKQNSGAGDFTLTMQPRPPQTVRPHNKAGERPPHYRAPTLLPPLPSSRALEPHLCLLGLRTDPTPSRPWTHSCRCSWRTTRARKGPSCRQPPSRRRPNPPRDNTTEKTPNAHPDIKQRQQGKFSADNQTVREPSVTKTLFR